MLRLRYALRHVVILQFLPASVFGRVIWGLFSWRYCWTTDENYCMYMEVGAKIKYLHGEKHFGALATN
jgi:hypothetical protein